MLRRAASAVPFVMLASLGSGCGTLTNQAEPGTMFNVSGVTPYRPYGGVRECASGLVDEARMVVGLPADDSLRDVDSLTAAAYATGIVFVDLPLSLVGDTLMLPFDVTKTLQGRGEPPEGGWPLVRVRDRAGQDSSAPVSASAGEADSGNRLSHLQSANFNNWAGSFRTIEPDAPPTSR